MVFPWFSPLEYLWNSPYVDMTDYLLKRRLDIGFSPGVAGF